jgi:hypothetical protein
MARIGELDMEGKCTDFALDLVVHLVFPPDRGINAVAAFNAVPRLVVTFAS